MTQKSPAAVASRIRPASQKARDPIMIVAKAPTTETLDACTGLDEVT